MKWTVGSEKAGIARLHGQGGGPPPPPPPPWPGLLAWLSPASPWAGEGGTRSAHLSRGGAQPASEHLPLVTAPPERRAAQPQPAQVLCARGERQGRRVDCGRAGVSEAETTKDDRVCGPGPGQGVSTRAWAWAPPRLPSAPTWGRGGEKRGAGAQGRRNLEMT